MKKLLLSGVVVLVPVAALAVDPEGDPAGLLPYRDMARVADGSVLYQENCAACHGGALEGEPDWRSRNDDGSLRAPPHDETGHTWHHPDGLLFEVTKFGTEVVTGGAVQSPMIGFADVLNDDEILSVLAYIKSTWPEHIIARHNEMNRRFSVSQ